MTLVSIVGDFYSNLLPLFYHFKDDITNHIIIYDDYKQDTLQAKKIILGTKRFIEKYNLPITTYTKQIDEDSYSKLELLSEYILSFQSEQEGVVVNITDGFAAIAFTLINRLEQHGVKFLSYDRFDNSYTALSPKSMTTPLKVATMSIEDHFLLKNIDIKERQSLEAAYEHETDIKELFEKYQGKRKFFRDTNPFVAKTQLGFLYEYYIFNLVKNLDFDDIALGVKVEDNYNGDAFENEFDILIMKENHLHMIECKARDDFEQNTVSSFIYKLDSVRTTVDEDANMLFLTQDKVYDPFLDGVVKNHISPYHRANARRVFLRGSPIGSVERFLRDVDRIFSLHSQNIDELAPKSKLPITDATKQKEIINEYFQKLSGLQIDFFNRTKLSKIFNYKVSYMTNEKVYKMMQNRKNVLLLKRINKMQDDVELQAHYNYFMINVKGEHI